MMPGGARHDWSARDASHQPGTAAVAVPVLGLAMVAAAQLCLDGARYGACASCAILADADVVQGRCDSGKPTVVEFGGIACAGCREMKPVLEELPREHGERITVLTIDVLKAREYIARYKIRLLPTQVFFDAQGRETGRNMGTISADEILARLGVSSAGRTP